MERVNGLYLRAGVFFGLGFVPLTGVLLCLFRHPWAGLFCILVGVVLLAIAYVEYRIFKHRHPPLEVP